MVILTATVLFMRSCWRSLVTGAVLSCSYRKHSFSPKEKSSLKRNVNSFFLYLDLLGLSAGTSRLYKTVIKYKIVPHCHMFSLRFKRVEKYLSTELWRLVFSEFWRAVRLSKAAVGS